MDLQKFSAFKYRHDGPRGISAQRWRTVQVTFGIALIVVVVFFPVGWFALLVPLTVYVTAAKMLYIGPRYLICGNTIVYFSNVNEMALEASAGQLRLATTNNRSFVLERDRFPTGARKAEKIAANKALKFDKVSAKLIQKVLKASPQAQLSGVTDAGR
jgi:hypothetical protein